MLVNRHERNEKFVNRVFGDHDFREYFIDLVAKRWFEEIRDEESEASA